MNSKCNLIIFFTFSILLFSTNLAVASTMEGGYEPIKDLILMKIFGYSKQIASSTNPISSKPVSLATLLKCDRLMVKERLSDLPLIDNPNEDPHVRFLAEFAVNEYNKQINRKIELQYVFIARYMKLTSGTAYYISLVGKRIDDGFHIIYEAIIFEGSSSTDPVLKLVEFNAIILVQ